MTVRRLTGSVDVASQTLQIYTDRRNPKIHEPINEPKAIFVFWSARLKDCGWAGGVTCTRRCAPMLGAIEKTPQIEDLWGFSIQLSSGGAGEIRTLEAV